MGLVLVFDRRRLLATGEGEGEAKRRSKEDRTPARPLPTQGDLSFLPIRKSVYLFQKGPIFSILFRYERQDGEEDLVACGTAGTCGIGEKKTISFEQNHPLTRSFYGSPPPPSALTGGSDVRGTVDPIRVRKIFNYFRSL